MSTSIKALLLSALVFPGAGHIFLKKYLIAAALAGSALIALYSIVSKAVEMANEIFLKIQGGEVSPDVAAISELVTQQTMSVDGQSMNIAATVLIVAWLIGIVDAYRLGRIQDRLTTK